jgi:PAS domain S-box-containing protein
MTFVDLSGRWTEVNRRLAEMLGYDDPRELVGAQLRRADPSRGTGRATGAFLRALDAAGPQSRRREKRFLRRDGGVVWVAVTAAVVRDADGRPLYRGPPWRT